MDFGYIRVSSHEQKTDRQLEGVNINIVFKDTISGKDIFRPALKECMAKIKGGDTLHVHSIDRLARNLQDLLKLLDEMISKGITVKFHKEKLTFTGESSPFQTLHLHIIGAVAEFERAFIRERQREGIELAKMKGKYKGKKPILNSKQIEEIAHRVAHRERVAALAKEFRVSRQTIYRSLQGVRRGSCLQKQKSTTL